MADLDNTTRFWISGVPKTVMVPDLLEALVLRLRTEPSTLYVDQIDSRPQKNGSYNVECSCRCTNDALSKEILNELFKQRVVVTSDREFNMILDFAEIFGSGSEAGEAPANPFATASSLAAVSHLPACLPPLPECSTTLDSSGAMGSGLARSSIVPPGNASVVAQPLPALSEGTGTDEKLEGQLPSLVRLSEAQLQQHLALTENVFSLSLERESSETIDIMEVGISPGSDVDASLLPADLLVVEPNSNSDDADTSGRPENTDCLPCVDAPLCSICLENATETPILLGCGHTFCQICLIHHAETILQAKQAPWCALCRCKLTHDEVSSLCPASAAAIEEADSRITDSEAADAPPRPLSQWQRHRARWAFKRAARKSHLKYCPDCHAMITKDGGCDHMRCRCGCSFSWDDALHVTPCNKVHCNSLLGKTCKDCTYLAKAKLAVFRALVTVPTIAVGATVAVAGATVVSAVPAVVCGPLALAYEPVRILRKKRRNPFAKSMRAGLNACAMVVYRALHEDSD